MRTSHLVLILGALVGSGALFGSYNLAIRPGFSNDPGPCVLLMVIGAAALIGAVVFAHNNKD